MAKKLMLVLVALVLSTALAGPPDFGHMRTAVVANGSTDFGDR
ncbi:hypothetical protein HNQ07_004279 [Deinococcus metalli]|uniref:Uncharacterized protein n=1 Tax=Deinococcus metalli TaxID=1141878 RepID=A0A7W8NTZ9_9DEIO|nr:hypothetical protein [Deinococcus metalli]MBB5378772.1 hypothetical protein [Deinococcus metalli]